MRRLLLVLAAIPALLPLDTAAQPRLLVAERDSGGLLVFEALATGPVQPELVVPGAGAGRRDLRLERRWLRDADGTWSAAGELPEGLTGRPFVHGLRPWTAMLVDDHRLGPTTAFHPLEDSVALTGYSRRPDARAVAVSALDPWHLLVVEQQADGTLSAAELTSHGTGQTLEDLGRHEQRPPWPPGTRLVEAAGRPGRPLVFGREPSGRLRLGELEGDSWEELPSFELAPESAVIPLRFGEVPAAVVVTDAELGLWRLAGRTWEAAGVQPIDGPGAADAWSAGRTGEGDELVALRLRDGALEAWSWKDGAWRSESVPEATLDAVVGKPRPDEDRDARRPSARGLVGLLLGAAALLGLVLAVLLVRGRR